MPLLNYRLTALFEHFQTDKASMLDEAIEYLKSLQLQVQVLFVSYISCLLIIVKYKVTRTTNHY